jgi:hypothetical protein
MVYRPAYVRFSKDHLNGPTRGDARNRSGVVIPRVAPVRQRVAAERVEDVAAVTRAGLRALSLRERVKPGARVAVAVGSRGIMCIYDVVRVVVEELRALDAQPFLVPAMGSHGGGTAAGQRSVLEGYGLGPEKLGIPILSSMETLQVGETDAGMPVYVDAHAAGADLQRLHGA